MRFDIASIRYRAVYPALCLEDCGYENLLTDKPGDVTNRLRDLSAVVIVKRLDAALLPLVSAAFDAGVPVFLDICDDILDTDYRGDHRDLHRMVFTAIAPNVAGVVTTTTAMKRRLAAFGYPAERIHVVPDIVESRELAAVGEEFLKRNTPPRPPAAAIASSARAGKGFLSRLASAVRHPRRSIKYWRETVRTVAFGSPDPKPTASAVEKRLSAEARAALAVEGDTVVWFGNHGAPNSDFGMLTLLRVARDLRAAYSQAPFTLIVISDHRAKWSHFIEPIGVPTVFVPWSLEAQRQLLGRARAFLMTVGEDTFSALKSANRALLAFEANVPVVYQRLESMVPFADVFPPDNIDRLLVKCLTEPKEMSARARDARVLAEKLYGKSTIRSLWRDLLSSAVAPVASRQRYGSSLRRQKLLILVSLKQDAGMAMTIFDEARKAGVETALLVSSEAIEQNPRFSEMLIERSVAPAFIEKEKSVARDSRWLQGATALFCPSESSAAAHRLAFALATLANEAGCRTFTAQHGLENTGLTYFDHDDPDVTFASSTIFTWSAVDDLPAFVSPGVRRRCVATGRVRPARQGDVAGVREALEGRRAIAIFENMHWRRYDQRFREQFIDCVKEAAASIDAAFVLAPHPAGLWSAGLDGAALGSNVTVVDPRKSEFAAFCAPALIEYACAVITTPSTIALDAAEQGGPTAIAIGDLGGGDFYAPLPLLRDGGQWTGFIKSALAGEVAPSPEFVARVNLGGSSAAEVMLEHMMGGEVGRSHIKAIA